MITKIKGIFGKILDTIIYIIVYFWRRLLLIGAVLGVITGVVKLVGYERNEKRIREAFEECERRHR